MKEPKYFKDKMVGLWDSELKTLYKTVDDSKHLMAMFQGSYGVDGDVLKALPDGSRINITNQRGEVYEATKEDYLNYNATKDFGHGVQYFLTRSKFPVRPGWTNPLRKELERQGISEPDEQTKLL